MLTEEKIKIYKRYEGDVDSWARSGTEKEKLAINDGDWHLIDSLIQDISLIKKRLTTIEFNNKIEHLLKENCKDQETIKKVKLLAEKMHK